MSKLTLAQANKIIEGALANARQLKIKPLAVAVLDDGGHIKSVQREDDATMFRVDVAIGKAWASVSMGAASRVLLGRAKENRSSSERCRPLRRASSCLKRVPC